MTEFRVAKHVSIELFTNQEYPLGMTYIGHVPMQVFQPRYIILENTNHKTLSGFSLSYHGRVIIPPLRFASHPESHRPQWRIIGSEETAHAFTREYGTHGHRIPMFEYRETDAETMKEGDEMRLECLFKPTKVIVQGITVE